MAKLKDKKALIVIIDRCFMLMDEDIWWELPPEEQKGFIELMREAWVQLMKQT